MRTKRNKPRFKRVQRTPDLETVKLRWCPECRRLSFDGQCRYCNRHAEDKAVVSLVRGKMIVSTVRGDVFA